MPKKKPEFFKHIKESAISLFLVKLSLSLLKPIDQIIVLLKYLFEIRLFRIILGGIFVILFFPVILFVFLRPVPQKNINYGVNFSNKYSAEIGQDWKVAYVKILDDLGAKNVRLVAYWDDIERTKDEYNFSDIKWQLSEAESRGINVIMTVGRKVPRYPECFEPAWWKNTQNEELKNDELYQYISDTIIELRDFKSIKMWQVENEPFFPFGVCTEIKSSVVRNEVTLVRALDDRPILIQDSGEGGLWYPSYKLGDYLAISMYRKIWYDFWGAFLGNFIYFEYPLAHWTYKIKADLVQVPYEKIIVTELQAEPWGPGINSKLSQEDKDQTMSKQDFISTINYAQKAGFKDLYFWGAEWWLWEKENNNNPYFWDTAKALFK
ncbi:hypothetical protein A2415_00125 [candidate division WWE3 bacterium RIFOXYC1_FULL_39_7]|uniref:Glycoside hydrolase family 5 domain-containing protein n=1 Tax=candidate division WWE3 bacterium RIFOXYC1_FULL_39_7 TaxID=1802643 RepID=A0A1F4WKF6_UNCKA|nr:MAG: hypothetical protein A2415_00125 [candidate division WWE3 bacterium RIFOXYC1_FULL_39_7]